MPEYVREPDRRGATELPDRRAIGWAEWGPEDGVPILHCPGAATSCAHGFGADVVDDLGVRLVALDRPGLGASSPRPGRTLLDWADDVRAFVDARRLEAPCIVGFSQGAPFALACAAAGIVRAAAIVSAADEIAAPELRGSLVPELRALVDRVESDPEGAEAFFRGMTAETMRGMVLSGSPDVDRVVYADPAFDAAYRRALDEAFAQGLGGYARDTVLAMGRWPFDLEGITVPVDVWYGAIDTSPVHSADLGAKLARRIPGARRRVVEGAGGAVLWTHARTILEALLSIRRACASSPSSRRPRSSD